MKRAFRRPLAGALLLILCAAGAWGQSASREPSVGYVYPAGGRQGTSFQITVGGQNLQGVSRLLVSGGGANATQIRHVPPLNPQQRMELQRRLTEIRDKRMAALAARNPAAAARLEERRQEAGQERRPDTSERRPPASEGPPKPVALPDLPMLRDLDSKSNEELRRVADMFLNPNRKQPAKRSILELAIIDIVIAADAVPGDRELRLGTPEGLTNPLRFQVGLAPETVAQEANEASPPPGTATDLPMVFNGQLLPGEVDRFRFRAHAGQNLVMEAQARRLIPYMADAVPGWFQAVLTLYNSNGRELAYADDYRISPDPVLFYHVPLDGEYVVEVRDAIYRGREDFIYRLLIGERPFVTQMFPLGGSTGTEAMVSIGGWNLPESRLKLDTRPGPEDVRYAVLNRDKWISNRLPYVVDELPECTDTEPNDAGANAQCLTPPQAVNGRISRPGDADVFCFDGRANDEIVAEVFARRLDSPLDSLLRVTDAAARLLAWNDDTEDKGTGLSTHHADSYVSLRLPTDGRYFVQITDAQGHGGEEYAYRLRVGPPRPRFDLRVTPSAVNVAAGCAAVLTVHALRRDGFDGDIELALKDAPPGFRLNGRRIPAGRNSVRVTLTAPKQPFSEPVVLQMEGGAIIGGRTVIRPAVAAEDMIQAFDYRHLVPAEALMAAVLPAKPRTPTMELVEDRPLTIPAGSSAQVRARVPRRMQFMTVALELRDPPAGLSIGDIRVVGNIITFALKTDASTVQPDLADNLIVEAFTQWPVGAPDDKGVRANRPVSLGVLPAIPIKIVPH
jgi:hypothetical protein